MICLSFSKFCDKLAWNVSALAIVPHLSKVPKSHIHVTVDSCGVRIILVLLMLHRNGAENCVKRLCQYEHFRVFQTLPLCLRLNIIILGAPGACFKCGVSGHMSRECPQGGGGGGGKLLLDHFLELFIDIYRQSEQKPRFKLVKMCEFSRLSDWLDWFWLIDWLIGWFVDGLIDWLVDLLMDWLIDYLLDWMIVVTLAASCHLQCRSVGTESNDCFMSILVRAWLFCVINAEVVWYRL